MKRVLLLGLIVIPIVGFLVLFLNTSHRQEPPVPTTKLARPAASEQTVKEEVFGIVRYGDETHQYSKAVRSDQLRNRLESDPEYVLVCLVTAEAQSWPRLSKDDAARILDLAETAPADALEGLRSCMIKSMKDRMTEEGIDPNTHDWQSIHDNNTANSYLFIEYPVALRLGKVSEFVSDHVLRTTNMDPAWWEGDLTFKEMMDWSKGGKWPWPGETPQGAYISKL